MNRFKKMACVMAAVTVSVAAAKDRVFFFSAHPDDIISSLGTCLLMKDRYEIHVCDFTYGERGRGEAGFLDGSTKAMRIKEEEAVCAAIGAKLHWYGAEDGNTWATKEQCMKLVELLKELQPRAVFGHWPLDVHNDHAMSAAVLQRAVKLAKLDCEFYFFEESYDSKGFPDTFYVDITAVAKEKERIIRLYACQNGNDLMCREEMANSHFRGERLNITNPKTGRSGSAGGKFAEAFAVYVGRPQNPIVFGELDRESDPALAETREIQWRIDEAAAKGGGVVSVSPGLHRVGQLELKSNVELHLEDGAVLRGLPGLENYRIVTLPYSEGNWSGVVFALGVTNVAVTGRGTIDGDGIAWPLPVKGHGGEGERARGMFFGNSKDIRLEGFTLRDSACWGCVLKCCDGVKIRGVTIDNHANTNNDGFDIEAKNVTIEDCDIDAGDDACCLKSNDPNFTVENVLVRNCIARSHCNGFKIGTATHGTVRNVRFENCRTEAPRRYFAERRPGAKHPGRNFYYRSGYGHLPNGVGLAAIAIENVDGGTVEDVVADGFDISGFMCPIFVRAGTRKGRSCGTPPSDKYVFRNITIANVRGRAESVIPSSITGVDGCIVRNVTLRNVDLVCRAADAKAAQKALDTPVPDVSGRYPECQMFMPHILPSYGLYVDKVDGISAENVRFTLPENQRDPRPAITGLR